MENDHVPELPSGSMSLSTNDRGNDDLAVGQMTASKEPGPQQSGGTVVEADADGGGARVDALRQGAKDSTRGPQTKSVPIDEIEAVRVSNSYVK